MACCQTAPRLLLCLVLLRRGRPRQYKPMGVIALYKVHLRAAAALPELLPGLATCHQKLGGHHRARRQHKVRSSPDCEGAQHLGAAQGLAKGIQHRGEVIALRWQGAGREQAGIKE